MQADSRARFLDVALKVIRSKGYTATSVEDLCTEAKLTKGSFFHHFASKQDLGVAAAEYWSKITDALFAAAPYQAIEDPLQRLLGYVDFRAAILRGELPEFTCLVGTMVQEVYDTHPQIRAACDRSISNHAANVEKIIVEAMSRYRIKSDWTAASLALHTQAVLQGAFILAKSKEDPAVAAESIAHLRRYIELLFAQPQKRKKKHVRPR